MIELAPGVHALGHKAGGRVHAFLIDAGGELTLVDTLFEGDARLVLKAIDALGRAPSDLKRIAITHAHRSHLGGLAELKRRTNATVHAHEWEADIIAGERRAQPVTILPKQSLKLIPFQLGLRFNRPRHTPCPVDETIDEGDALGPLQVLHAPGPLARAPCVPLARARVPDRRRRDRDLARGVRRLDRVQPQPRPAHGVTAPDGVRSSLVSSASGTVTRSSRAPRSRCTSSRRDAQLDAA